MHFYIDSGLKQNLDLVGGCYNPAQAHHDPNTAIHQISLDQNQSDELILKTVLG